MHNVVSVVLSLFIICVFSNQQDFKAEFYQRYNIPPDAKEVIVFGQASHLDWDWLNWFPTNVNNNPPSVINYWSTNVQPTDQIFARATQYLSDSNYGYSVCEMGFLRRFAVDNPQGWAKMKNSPGKLHIVGGGITSPDNLLPHGESFIRDYLVGVSWLKTQNITWTGKIWLPDDFGHDSQLPVMLSSLGVTATSFSRVPGACNQGPDTVPSGFISAHHVLLDTSSGGLDFWWQANDGSTSYIYYQPNHYCCGDGILDSTREPSTPQQQSQCQSSAVRNTTDRIYAYIGVRSPLKKTPYMYVATGCDFRVPIPGLVSVLDQWNSAEYPKNGIYAVAASFEDYSDLVLDYVSKNGVLLDRRNFHGSTPSTTFKPTPYWMGFYASRVANKQLHFEAVKALVGAEIFLSIGLKTKIPTSVKKEQIESTWNYTVPSTHHDYITGTATDYVVDGEQRPLLQSVYNEGTNFRNSLIGDITTALSGSNTHAAYVAFNQLGYSRTGVGAIDFGGLSENEISKLPNIQKTATGDFIAIYSAPSLGYSTTTASEQPSFDGLRVESKADSYVLENSFLQATVAKNVNWAISSLVDKSTGKSFVQYANTLQFRKDNGDIYRFGHEEGCGFDNYNPTITALDGTLVENGPVRVTVQAAITVSTNSWTKTYGIQYSLVSNEPFLRVTVNGSAGDFTTILTEIKFNDLVDTYEHGTPYHWDYKSPFPYGKQNDFKVTFEATHDFVVAKSSSGAILGAIYQNSTPAWGVSEDKTTLYGVLLRNSPSGCGGKGATGHDTLTHTVSYAIRIPSRLQGAISGQPLQEARAFHTPLIVKYIPNVSNNVLPATYSLASLSSPSSGIITVAKPGEYDGNSIFLRVYIPDNVPNQITISLAPVFSSSTYNAQITTSLEEPTSTNIPVQWNSQNSISFKPIGALSTVRLVPK